MKTDALEPFAGTEPVVASSRGAQPENCRAARPGGVLVPLDLSAESLLALKYAVPIARQTGAKLTLLHILSPPICVSDFPYPGPGGEDCFEAVGRELEEIRAAQIPPGMPVETMVRQGYVVDGILDAARETGAGCIVFASDCKRKFKHLFSLSIPESVARHAGCRVLVTRPHGDATARAA